MGDFSKKMDAISLMYTIATVVAVGILIWLRSKPGKKWLANL